MLGRTEHFIGGAWVAPLTNGGAVEVVNPATEDVVGVAALGSSEDVDRAVQAARKAFVDFSQTSVDERIALLERIIACYEPRARELAMLMSVEMGAPISFAYHVQALSAIDQFRGAISALRRFPMRRTVDGAEIVHEPIGVCGLITAWNWPIMLIALKVAYALAAGCTIVLKPSEVAPLSAMAFADILHEAGVPPGVFNLVNGDGPTVGHAITVHPQVDMISFTGSTRAGILVAQAAAESVKRVHQELGGKSANIVLPDADLPSAVMANLRRLFGNAGQSCQAPTRLLVDHRRYEEALHHARLAVEQMQCGDPSDPDTFLGPVASASQYDRVRGFIELGVTEGARLITGGLDRPAGLDRGYFIRPTVFGDVDARMTIAQAEIFGPVLPILSYSDIDEAVEIANNTPYGLAAYVQAFDSDSAKALALRLNAGRVYINTMEPNMNAPFGGYKQSGNGREQGEMGLEAYLETKAVII